jgi:crotonobetainyl-CoA:carnitine CoA-transferase CaiB-like acyl-CoA transferase
MTPTATLVRPRWTVQGPAIIEALEPGPLSDLVVVVHGQHVAKAEFRKLFAELGATVIEVSSLKTRGDGARFVPPLYGDNDSYFYWLGNSGPGANIAVDPTTPEGREVTHRLHARADVLVSNSPLKVQRDCGYDWARLHERYPWLIAGYLTFAGLTGPLAEMTGFHHTALAMAGVALLNSVEGAALGAIPWVDHGAANRLVVGILAALYERDRPGRGTGRGQLVETSLLEYAVEKTGYHAGIAWTPHLRKLIHVDAKQWDRHLTVPTLFLARCKYGERVVVGAVMPAQVSKLFQALDLAHLLSDPRFASAEARRANAHGLLAILHDRTRRLSGQELVELIRTRSNNGVPVALCEDIANVCTDPHLIERGMICRTPGPDGQDLTIPGFALRLGDAAPRRRRVRARRSGEDTAAVLQRVLDFSPDDLRDLERAGAVLCYRGPD